MLTTLKNIWNDERGFVNSMELILVATLAVIGMIVGLATFRDAVTQELADTGASVGQLNQSYSVNIQSSPNNDPDIGPAITSAGTPGEVTVERDFFIGITERVQVDATFRNYSYLDNSDIGDGQDTADGLAPPGITNINAAPTNEGNL